MGNGALDACTTSENTAVGTDSLGALSTGNSNTAIGADSAEFLTTGNSCVAVGHDCMRYSNGSFNVAVGRRALLGSSGNTSGQYNTAMGYDALKSLTTGAQNVAIGQAAGDACTTGYQNTYVGDNAGNTHATGANCIFVGHGSNGSATTVSLEYVFGVGLSGKGTQTCFLGGNTGAYNEANESHFDTTSDQRIKKNIVNYDTGLSIINQLQVRNFEYKTEDEIKTDNPELTDVIKSAVVNKTGTQTGLIAQEAEAVLASTVVTNSTGIKTLHTDDIFWHMLNAIKELSTKNDALEARIKTLEG